MNRCSRVFVLSVLLAAALSTLSAQVIPIVSNVSAPPATQNKPVLVKVDLSQDAGVTGVMFYYRQFGESEYRMLEMVRSGRTASVTLPAGLVRPPYLEYYISVQMVTGRAETYPVQNPEVNPLKLTIKEANPKDQEVRFLSPEPGQTVAAEELVIVLSLFYVSDAVNPAATRLYLDGVDVTAKAVFSEDVLIFSPANFPRPLNLGSHFIRVELRDTTGALYHRLEESFTLSTAAALKAEEERFRAAIDGDAELRREQLSGSSATYARGNLRVNSAYSGYRFGGALYLDNQDKVDRQPQNRYSLFADADFLRLQIGDSYPVFPTLVMSGRRVRGFTGNLALGFFNLDVTLGQGLRSIEGRVDSTRAVDSAAIPSLPTNTKLLRDTTYEYFTSGTYARDFLAVRPSFGSGENFQLGFTYMKAKDDVASISYGVTPEENLLVGTDILIAFDDQRFKLEGQASLGLSNKDISGGNFSDADYDSLEAQNEDLGKQLKKIRPLAEQLITVNENLFPTNPVGTGLPGVAFEGMLSLNYLNNYFQAGFFRRGAGYRSLGNEFLQTDIQGFIVSDRIRMFTNRVFLSVSYEQKSDNTADTKSETRTFSNLNTSLTLALPNIPGLTIGYGHYALLSDRDVARPYLPDSIAALPGTERRKSADDATGRFFIGSSYDFNALARQNLTVNLSIANRDDKTFFERDQSNLYVQATLTTTYRLPLQTIVGLVVSHNANDLMLFTPGGLDSTRLTTRFDYTTVLTGAQYRLLSDRLRLAASLAPSFGSIERTSVRFDADYAISEQHSLEFVFNYMQNAGREDDTIAGLIYRFSF
jgi:hypothetical protein